MILALLKKLIEKIYLKIQLKEAVDENLTRDDFIIILEEAGKIEGFNGLLSTMMARDRDQFFNKPSDEIKGQFKRAAFIKNVAMGKLSQPETQPINHRYE